MFENDATIYVSSLPKDYSNDQANEFFGNAGKIKNILLKNYKSSEGKYAFVTYENKEEAVKAFDTLNYTKIGNNEIFIQFAAKNFRDLRAKSLNSVIVRDVPEDETDRTMYEKYKEFGQIVFLHLQKRNPRVCYIQYLNENSVENSKAEKYEYKTLADTYREVKISGIQEKDFNGVSLLVNELGETESVEKGKDSLTIRFHEHEVAKSCSDFLHNCIVGSSVIKVEISEKVNNEYRYCFVELVTHMNDEADFTVIALRNLPKSVQCGQDVRVICEKYGNVRSPRLSLDESWNSLGSAICMMMTHEDAVKAIEGINKEGSGIVASRSITTEESKILKEEMNKSLSVAQKNSSKDRQFLIHGCKSEETMEEIKKAFKVARSITKCGYLVLVIFKDTKQLDNAVSAYSGSYGDLLFFNKDESIPSVPLGKTFPPQARFPFRNNIIERLKIRIMANGIKVNPEKFDDISPDVARFLIAHEKVLNAWLEE